MPGVGTMRSFLAKLPGCRRGSMLRMSVLDVPLEQGVLGPQDGDRLDGMWIVRGPASLSPKYPTLPVTARRAAVERGLVGEKASGAYRPRAARERRCVQCRTHRAGRPAAADAPPSPCCSSANGRHRLEVPWIRRALRLPGERLRWWLPVRALGGPAVCRSSTAESSWVVGAL